MGMFYARQAFFVCLAKQVTASMLVVEERGWTRANQVPGFAKCWMMQRSGTLGGKMLKRDRWRDVYPLAWRQVRYRSTSASHNAASTRWICSSSVVSVICTASRRFARSATACEALPCPSCAA
jgi:hypothetical protein